MTTLRTLTLLTLTAILTACGSDGPAAPEPGPLEEVVPEVVLFEFTPDTGNESYRLRWEIAFTNPNSVAVRGFYRITINADGLESVSLSSARSPCYTIGPRERCTVTFDEEERFDIARPASIQLVSVGYRIEE